MTQRQTGRDRNRPRWGRGHYFPSIICVYPISLLSVQQSVMLLVLFVLLNCAGMIPDDHPTFTFFLALTKLSSKPGLREVAAAPCITMCLSPFRLPSSHSPTLAKILTPGGRSEHDAFSASHNTLSAKEKKETEPAKGMAENKPVRHRSPYQRPFLCS